MNRRILVNIAAIALITYLNIISTNSIPLSIVVTLLEYILVYRALWKNDNIQALALFIIFTSVSMEMDSFIFFDGSAPLRRMTFLTGAFSIKLLYSLTSFIIYYQIKKSYNSNDNESVLDIKKWLKIIIVSGLISIIFAMVINDNNIVGSGEYPSTLFYTLLSFGALCFTLFATAYAISYEDNWYYLSNYCVYTLAGISVATIISILQGYNGWYGMEKTMLAPLLSGFIPCLIMFYGSDIKGGWLLLLLAVIVIVLSFSLPSVIGSKWFIVISFSMVYFIYNSFGIKSPWIFIALCVIGITVLPMAAELVSPLFGNNEFNEFKFQQAMGVFNISNQSFLGWFMQLEESAQFRVDEPINIFMEYMNKPYFAIFGKGLAGTTLHYTNFVNWDAASAFSEVQRQYGFYYNMHESFSIIFLRHGLVGILFFISMLATLIKRITKTPWAVVGIIWLVFYWSYGESFRLGAVAWILAICAPQFVEANRMINRNN